MRSGALKWLLVAVGAPLLIAPVWGQPADWEAGIAHITTRRDLNRAPGTAFAVALRNGNAYLVTSAHVVEGDDSPQVEFVADPEKVFRATVRVIEAGDERGLALLVVANPPSGVRPIPESSQAFGLQAGVSVAGYPSSLNTFSVVDTTVAALRGRDVFLSRETDEGFSGGPVVIAGAVVGIVYGREPGFGKALGASSIKPFIEGNSLEWAIVGATNQQPSTAAVAGSTARSPTTPPVGGSAAEILRSTGRNPAPAGAAAAALIPGQTRENPKDGLTYVWIPPGKFTMGCSPGDTECGDTEKPPREVTITRGFWMGRTEVTVGAYGSLRRVPEANGSAILPVVNMTWDEAKAFCESAGMRLPTEAEWEYAARAGTTGPRYGALDEIAWHRGNNHGGGLQPVGTKQPNAWGLYDMFGNAYEWVADWDGAYQAGAVTDPEGPSSGQLRVLRGGGYGNDPPTFRASFRWSAGPSQPSTDVGFRCAGELPLASVARTATPAGVQIQPAATPTAAPREPGQTGENFKDGLTYVWIPPGKFTMGCSPGDGDCLDNEKPPHEVTIMRGFWMGRTEVTVGAYGSLRKVPGGNGSAILPVVNVTWDEAKAFCESAGMRLPTEAEWEYAARAGTTGSRYGMPDAIAWHSGNNNGSLSPVGRKEPNDWGLYDMLGNAAEWVADWHGNYQQIPGVDPTGPQRGEDRMWRGGSLKFSPEALRVSVRSWDKPTFRNNGIGFRCAGDLP